MLFRRWAGKPRLSGAVTLALLLVLLAAGCGSPSGRAQVRPSSGVPSSKGATLSVEAARNVVVQTWVRHLASFVALDVNSLPDSEAGFQLETDKLALPVAAAEGKQENQYQPTGNVDWVALPSTGPQLVMLAHVRTTWQPRPSTSLQPATEDDLVVLERQAVGQKWRIVGYPALDPSEATSLSGVRQLRGAYPKGSSSSLPIPPSSLAEAYWAYVGGGANAPFSPGVSTDQRRASLQQTITSYSEAGASLSFPFEAGSVIAAYGAGGKGDGLVLFGVRYAEVLTAPTGRCIVQSSTQGVLPRSVPAGKYAQVRLELRDVDVALENRSTGTVTVLGYFSTMVGQATTPTDAPACL